jgi:hypothetical protein
MVVLNLPLLRVLPKFLHIVSRHHMASQCIPSRHQVLGAYLADVHFETHERQAEEHPASLRTGTPPRPARATRIRFARVQAQSCYLTTSDVAGAQSSDVQGRQPQRVAGGHRCHPSSTHDVTIARLGTSLHLPGLGLDTLWVRGDVRRV